MVKLRQLLYQKFVRFVMNYNWISKSFVDWGLMGHPLYMLGVHGGVSTLLKQQTPFLVASHCIAHHLALACGQAANGFNLCED